MQAKMWLDVEKFLNESHKIDTKMLPLDSKSMLSSFNHVLKICKSFILSMLYLAKA